MFWKKDKTRVDYTVCHGCGVCLLVCPTWQQTKDVTKTPHGWAKALQGGVPAQDLSAEAFTCMLCGACEPACPQEIEVMDFIFDLRRKGSDKKRADSQNQFIVNLLDTAQPSTESTLLIYGADLQSDATVLDKILQKLNVSTTLVPDSSDLVQQIEYGHTGAEKRLSSFLSPFMKKAQKIVVADRTLYRSIRKWLPDKKVVSLGEALTGLSAIRKALLDTDLYIIESRAYHANYQHFVKYYDAIRQERGCMMSLDMQRLAIPTIPSKFQEELNMGAADSKEQARWILQSRQPERIVVETVADRELFQGLVDVPVVHLVDVAE